MVNDYKKYFIFNGKKSSDFDVWASGLNIFHSPERRIERIQVPGRNGELLIEDGSFENTELLFKDCFIPRHFSENFTNLSNYLNRQKGYQRLELSWLPDEYRLAAFHGDIEASMKNWDGVGKFDLAFDCKPQRFLKSGEEPIYIIPPYFSGTSMRTQKYESTMMPLIYAYAYEGVTFGSLTFNVYYYDDDDLVDTYTETITRAGMLTAYTGTVFNGWRAEINFGSENPDNYFFTIGVNPESNSITQGTALWARTIKIQNPTGFVCKPLIHSVGAALPLKRVTLSDGEIWQINCDDYSHLTTSTYLDCENEYFYYIEDGKKKNVTNYMTITHTDGDGNDLPVSFPVFGEDETTFYVYVMGSNAGQFLEIYPRWYTI